jgi:hypothetical protein
LDGLWWLAGANFVSLANLGDRIAAVIAEWNAAAHPFKWSCASFTKILPGVNAAIAAATTPVEPAEVAA